MLKTSLARLILGVFLVGALVSGCTRAAATVSQSTAVPTATTQAPGPTVAAPTRRPAATATPRLALPSPSPVATDIAVLPAVPTPTTLAPVSPPVPTRVILAGPVAKVVVGYTASGVAVNPAKHRVYAASAGGNSLTIIDSTTNKALLTSQSGRPRSASALTRRPTESTSRTVRATAFP
ncbi:MAG TPA: hypothetical protein VMW65_15105 [Chloroflexota bacterium]|nr:hypothetical protein [Chloroflexota bacterium]